MDDEDDFLSLVLTRRPELRDLLLKPVTVLCKELVCLPAGTAFRPPSIYSRTRPAPSPTAAPRKLTIKARIEGASCPRSDGSAQPVKPPAAQQPVKSTSPLAAPHLSSDTETAGAQAYAPTTADDGDEFTSDEDLVQDTAVDAHMLQLPADADYAAADVPSQTGPSRRGTFDGALPRACAGPLPAAASPRRVRSTSSPCGIDLSGGDEYDDGDGDYSGGGGSRYGDTYGDYGGYGTGPHGHPNRHLAASPSFRDMAKGWGRRPPREVLSGLRLEGIPVRAASPVPAIILAATTGFGSRIGTAAAATGGREPHQHSSEAFAAAPAPPPPRWRCAASQDDALAPLPSPQPALLAPIPCPPQRLSRDDGWEAADGGAAAAGGSPGFGVQAPPAPPDPRVVDERHLRNCRSSGTQSFLPSSRAKHLAARLRQLRSHLSRFSPSPSPEPQAPGDDGDAGPDADGLAGDAPACDNCDSPLMRMASSPARMMLARSSPLPFLQAGPDMDAAKVGDGDYEDNEGPAGGGSSPAQTGPSSASTTPQRRSATVLDLQLQLHGGGGGGGGGNSGGGGGGGGGGASPRLRGPSTTAPGTAVVVGGFTGMSVRALAAAAGTADGAGVLHPQPQSAPHAHSPPHSGALVLVDVEAAPPGGGGAATAAVLGNNNNNNNSNNRQTMQLPLRQPQPPLLPYGGILRLAASHGGGGVSFVGSHPRGNLSVGRQPPQVQSRSCNAPLPRGGGGGGGHPNTSRGVLVLRSMTGSEAKTTMSLPPSPGPPASPALAAAGGGERSAARVGGVGGNIAAAASITSLQSPRRQRCSDSGAAPRLDTAGGSGGSAPGCLDGVVDGAAVGRVAPPSPPMLLADFLAAEGDGAGTGMRLGVHGNCRPEAAAAAPPLLPSLRYQKGFKGNPHGGSPNRPNRHVLPPPQSGPLVRQEHRRSYTGGGFVSEGGGGGGGGGRVSGTAETGLGGGFGGTTAVAVVLAVADGSPDTRQHRQYKLSYTSTVAAPSVTAVRHSSETNPSPGPGPGPSPNPGRVSGGLLPPVFNHQTFIRSASKPSPGAGGPVAVPFPTVAASQPRPTE